MKKTDFLNVHFKELQLYKTTNQWRYDITNTDYYELFYVFQGIVMIYEQNLKYVLNTGDLLILPPGAFYGGIKTTNRTSFYKLQFVGKIPEEMLEVKNNLSITSLFKELLYYQNIPDDMSEATDIITKHILISAKYSHNARSSSFIAHEIYAWIQTNISAQISVVDVANYFNYNPEYTSRLIKREYGITLKALISKLLCTKIKDYLLIGNYPINAIAESLKFKDTSALTHFFKYHEKMYPSEFRNLHIDNKNALKEQK